MLKRDTLFFFGPVLCVMTGISTFLVSACFAEPDSKNITGPSGCDMVCVFYFPLHLLLWIVVGLVVLVSYFFRYRGSQIGNDNDGVRAVIGYMAGGLLVIAAAIVASEIGACLAALVVSLVFNVVPASLVMGVGILMTMKNRKKLADRAPNEAAKNVLFPSLD